MSTINITEQIDKLRSLINSLKVGIPGKYYPGRRGVRPDDRIEGTKRELLRGLDLVEFLEGKIEKIIFKAEQRARKK